MRQLVFLCLWAWPLLDAGQAQHINGTSPWSIENLGHLLHQCLISAEAWQCMGVQLEQLLDVARQDNSSWQLSEYLSLEPQQTDKLEQVERVGQTEQADRARSAPGLADKLLQLAESRALRVRLPRQLTIANDIDDFNTELSLDEGRKKKDKDKNMAMMGGMIMMATFAQMFLGKVIFIAGAAFIMAKIALVISLLGSLKKGSTGNSGSTDHVIVASGGHSHESGWHRSMPKHDYSEVHVEAATEEAPPAHQQAYYAYEMEQPYRRQLALTKGSQAGKPGFL